MVRSTFPQFLPKSLQAARFHKQVVKVKSQQRAKKFSDFLHLIGEEAVRFPVKLIPVVEENSSAPQAVLVLDSTLAEKRKGELEKAVSADRPPETKREQHIALLDKASALTGAESFKDCIHAELARVKKSRLPCSLLLIRIDGIENRSFIQKAAATLKKEILVDHHLVHFDHATLALLLPGLNRNRALRQAGAIHQSLSADTAGRVTIGLAVCMAMAVPAAEEFMAMALNELQKAEYEAGDIFYSFHNQDDDSCQVTAEERTQLFSFLNKGKKE
jgi:GGDEF domain-containing protein